MGFEVRFFLRALSSASAQVVDGVVGLAWCVLAAAIFDMDGLLIDSEPLWRSAHIAAVADYGVAITQDDVRVMAGKRTDEVVRHWRETHNLRHISNEKLEACVVDRVSENIRLHGEELPGVSRLMALCAEHGVPRAIASSSAPDIIDLVVRTLGLGEHIQVAHSAKHEKFGKPHPAVFLTTAAKLGVAAADCVVFEDSLNGVRAAKAAGMKCIAVPEAAQSDHAAFKEEADFVVSSLQQVDWPLLSQLFA